MIHAPTDVDRPSELDQILDHFTKEFECMTSGIDCKDEIQAIRISVFARPSIVRSTFAFIEAIIFNLKVVALEDNETGTALSQAERSLCEERAYELNERGEIEARPARLRFRPNFRFGFRVASKRLGLSFDLETDGDGWGNLGKAVKIRDRLTHPKNAADLRVSDEELLTVLRARSWVAMEYVRWASLWVESLEEEHGQLKDEITRLEREGVILEKAITWAKRKISQLPPQ
jgi:hypothetical protein